MSDLIPIQINLMPETVRKIEYLKEFFHASGKTDALSRAIRLAYSIATETENGSRIEAHCANGDVKQLQFVVDP